MTDRDDRIFSIEGRLNALEIQIAALVVQINGVRQVGKVIALMVGAALGVDILPMIGGA